MKAYENDTRIRIPKWYYFVPSIIVNGIVKLFDFIYSIKPKKRREITLDNKKNITFYL